MPRKVKKEDIPRRKIARYGWKPDLPDHRDLLYAAPLTALTKGAPAQGRPSQRMPACV